MDVFGDIVYIIENAQQFWSELEEILQLPEGATLTQLDSALKRSVAFCATYHEQYLQAPAQLDHACSILLESELFKFHSERMTEHLLRDAELTTDPHAQLILYKVLLSYGRNHHSLLRSHKKWQPLIPLLMDHVLLEFDPDFEDGAATSTAHHLHQHALVGASGWPKGFVIPIEARLRLLAVKILYEVCRVQKFALADLRAYDDAFIEHLFDLVEQTRHMQDETLNYSVIKLIVALNEQFMVASIKPHAPRSPPRSPSPASNHSAPHSHQPLPQNSKALSPEEHNRVVRILMRRLGSSKTFGENMIFMLNRANRTPEDLCMQLLILKILYVLFSTEGTSEYFYTNDLCVLVDVFLRELVNLDEDNESLRHTYLRVLHPLLTRTQLRTVKYKHEQIARTLESLVSRSDIREVSPTTQRLVQRCLKSDWLAQLRNLDIGSDNINGKGNLGTSIPRLTYDSPSPSPTTSDGVISTTKSDILPTTSGDARHHHTHHSHQKSKKPHLKATRSVECLAGSSLPSSHSTAHAHSSPPSQLNSPTYPSSASHQQLQAKSRSLKPTSTAIELNLSSSASSSMAAIAIATASSGSRGNVNTSNGSGHGNGSHSGSGGARRVTHDGAIGSGSGGLPSSHSTHRVPQSGSVTGLPASSPLSTTFSTSSFAASTPSLIQPSPCPSPAPSFSASSSTSNSAPKRRKPPAIPAKRSSASSTATASSRGTTITTIASSML